MVLHHGPTDEECANLDSPVAGEGPCAFESAEEPTGWKAKDFSIDNWQPAKEFSEREVRPKDGYDRAAWDASSKLIWSDDLKKDNTVIFRIVIDQPEQQLWS